MKKLLSVLSFLLVTNFIFAQKTLKEGAITYAISDVKAKGKNAMASQMLNGIIMTMYFNESQQKINMNMMNGMMKMQMFTNPKEKTMRSFMDMMGQKMEMTGIDSTYKYGLEHPAKVDSTAEKAKATGKTKEILGYKCDEYVVKSMVKEKEINGYIYVTKDLIVDKALWRNKEVGMIPMLDGSQVPGFPMEMGMETAEMSLKMTVTKIDEKIDSKEFIIPEGYKKMDAKSMRGMRGGF